MVDLQPIDLPMFEAAPKTWLDLRTKHALPFKQLCITTLPEKIDDPRFGADSLIYNWDGMTYNDDGSTTIPKYDTELAESEFIEIATIFKNTVFEDMVESIKTQFNVGRIRLMPLKPKTCLSWHVDYDYRLHYPIITNTSAKMVIEDTAYHLEAHKWILANTKIPHTIFNGGKEVRIHLVANILGEK